MNDPSDPISVALEVTGVLDALGVTHTIGGSIASSVAGEPRSTIDVDIVAALRGEQVAEFAKRLAGDFYLDEGAIRRAVANSASVNLIHHDTSIKIDLFIAGGTALDAQQLARRIRVEVGWFRLSGDTSERQWRDILGIVRVQGDHLDRAYVRRNAGALAVEDLVDKLFGHLI